MHTLPDGQSLVSLKRNRESLKAHIQQVKRSRPVITLRIQCYHHETRHWRDNKGNHHSKQVRVNTHAASHVYHYSWVRDSGGDAYEHWPATLLAKVEVGKKWVFGDDYTRQHFAWYKRRFMRHNRRDAHYDFTRSLRSLSLASGSSSRCTQGPSQHWPARAGTGPRICYS